jgi:hypothetical protein
MVHRESPQRRSSSIKKGQQKMKNVLRLFVVLCFAFTSMVVLAQEPTGSLEGTISDPQGAIVQNAAISVRNVATNAARTATSSADGHFRVSQLAPGAYEVKVSASNFKTSVVSNVIIAVGQTVPLDVHLEIGGASEEVTVVSGGEAQIDRTDNTVGGVVNLRQIQNLPLNGRNFLDLAQLQPGVETVPGGGFDPTKANYTGISIAGQAGRSTQITVDGGSVVDNVVGTTTQNFSQEIIQEFQLGISNNNVSVGASGTGSVNVVSKSGTNEYHGNGYVYIRDDRFSAFPGLSRLDAANGIPPIARADRVPFDREQFGATFGGPIKKDKLFFFTNYEQNNQDAVALHNVPTSPGFSGFTPNPFDEKLFTTKVDWAASSKNSFFTRYSFNNNAQQVPFAPGTGIVPRDVPSKIFSSNDQLVSNKTHGLVAGLTTILTANLTNQAIYNFNDFSDIINPVTVGFPQIATFPDQIFRSGTNYIAPQTTFQSRNQVKDDVNYARGAHTWHFGGNWERSSITGLFDFAKPARIRIFDIGQPLNTEADFLNSPVRDISMGIGSGVLPFNTPGGKTINHRWQFYGADTWKWTNRFTFNYGLSYRFDTNLWNHDQGHPASIAPLFGKGTAPSPRDNNNFSPRVGFAWDLGGTGRTVLRGGFGMYYDTTIDNLRLFERADLGKPGSELFLVGADIHSALLPGGDARFGSTATVIDPVSGLPVPNPTGFLTLAQALAVSPAVRTDVESRAFNCTLPTSIQCFGAISGPLFSTEFQVPYSLQYSFGLQRELPGNMVLQVDFNYRKGVHEVITYDINQHDNAVKGPRLSPAVFDNAVPYADSSGFSTYKALLLRLDRRFSHGFQMTASYGLSRFRAFGSDVLGLGAIGTDLNNLRAEFGPAGLDRTHRLVVSAVWDLPYFAKSESWAKRNVLGNWNVSFISTAFSGVPFSAFLPNSVDLSGTGTFLTYLPGTTPGALGRSIKTAADLNAIITTYNASIPTRGVACGADSPTGRCDLFGDAIERIVPLPAGTPVGGDSLISQDVRLTKTFQFTESVKLDLIGEVFNLFNIANYRDEANVNQVLDVEGTPATGRSFLLPAGRGTNVFGTGGPRAFQFAAKLRF